MGELTRPERLGIMLAAKELAAIDDWRFARRLPSRAAAVRELLRRGLAAEGKELASARRSSGSFGVLGEKSRKPRDVTRSQHVQFGEKLSPMAEKRLTQPPATLGDVLYAKSNAAVPEREWVALVQSIAAGDQLALHALYERSHRIVFTLIMRITASRETAEELTIDVFHDVWRRASGYDAANGTVLGWIMNQARSRAIDRLRFESRRKRTQGDNLEPLTEVAADPRDVLELREHRESLRAAMAVLTPEERQAIETTFFAGLTHAEAAARLKQPLGTIKTRIRSALHKLRHVLAEKESKG